MHNHEHKHLEEKTEQCTVFWITVHLCVSDIVPSPWTLVYCQWCPLLCWDIELCRQDAGIKAAIVLHIVKKVISIECGALFRKCTRSNVTKDPWIFPLWLLVYLLFNLSLYFTSSPMGINRKCRRIKLIQAECPVRLFIMDYTNESKFQMCDVEEKREQFP